MKDPADQPRSGRAGSHRSITATIILTAVCLGIAAIYAAMANLKGIGTDEGFRLGIINGGKEFVASEPGSKATWQDVLAAGNTYAYQPLYFLIQNSIMRVGHTHDEQVLKFVNVIFLWLSLQGLLALSRGWQLVPRLFLLGIFSLNAYLFMHVLQLREYIVGIAFYVWSTWLVLRLDHRILGRSWADVGWFASYGALLAIGFYTQLWVIFPAIAQGLFLAVHRVGDRVRYYAHLALSYVIVLSLTWPYLQTHSQKVNVGRWGSADTPLWSRLADGFHLVLSGHQFGRVPAAEFFFWFWLALAAVGAALLTIRRFWIVPEASSQEVKRQALLVALSLCVAVAFQIVYFYKVDTLSVWPRYFALHYFFVMWLVVLAFKALYDCATAGRLPTYGRLACQIGTGAAFAVMIVSAIFQVRSYHHDPYLDSGLSQDDNWRVLNAGLFRVLKPGDVLLTQDFLHAWTLTFTHPFPNPVVSVPKIGSGPYESAERFVYLEYGPYHPSRADLAAKLAGFGFITFHEVKLAAGNSAGTLPNWSVLIFQRH